LLIAIGAMFLLNISGIDSKEDGSDNRYGSINRSKLEDVQNFGHISMFMWDKTNFKEAAVTDFCIRNSAINQGSGI
jgi:hypothetical protein